MDPNQEDHAGLSLLKQRLDEDHDRFFMTSADDFEILVAGPDAQDLTLYPVRNTDEMETGVQAIESSAQFSIIIIPQEFSWGKFCITKGSFQKILEHYHVFDEFLECFMAFGMKTKENLKKLDVAFAKNSVAPGNDIVIRRELCYNFTYLAKNGRGRGDPWSLRQSGIYQQVDLKSNKSFWILLHPSASIKDQLNHFNGAFPIDRQDFGGHFLKGHTAFLSEATQGWDEYIENTRTQLDAIDEKARFSNVDHKYSEDYAVSFADCQLLASLQQRLMQATNVLRASRGVIDSCKYEFKNFEPIGSQYESREAVRALHKYSVQAYALQQRVQIANQMLQSTSELLHKLIEFRNYNVLFTVNESMSRSLEALRGIAAQNHTESVMLSKLSRQTQRDSKTVKVLALIATMYLPASLISSIFGSDLIKFPQLSSGSESSNMEVSSKMWIFVLISMVMSVLTLVCWFLLEKVWMIRTRT